MFSSALTIDGFPFPGETLFAKGGRHWYRNGVRLPNVEGERYQIPVTDVGAYLQCDLSQPVRVWHPGDIAGVWEVWLAWEGVFSEVGPERLAQGGEGVCQWRGQLRGVEVNQAVATKQPEWLENGGPGGIPALRFERARSCRLVSGSQEELQGHRVEGVLTAYVCRVSTAAMAPIFCTGKINALGGPRINLHAVSSSDETVFRVSYNLNSGVAKQASTPKVIGTWTSLGGFADFVEGQLSLYRDGGAASVMGLGTYEVSVGACFILVGAMVDGDTSSVIFDGDISCVVALGGAVPLTVVESNRLRQFVGLCAGKDLGLAIR